MYYVPRWTYCECEMFCYCRPKTETIEQKMNRVKDLILAGEYIYKACDKVGITLSQYNAHKDNDINKIKKKLKIESLTKRKNDMLKKIAEIEKEMKLYE